MTPVSRSSAAGRAYLDLKAKAKADGRLTDEMIHLYVLEGFLARLAASDHAGQLTLKGGALLAAFGTRRPTKDIDLAARALDRDSQHVLRLIRDIASHSLVTDDGLAFDAESATAEAIREDEEYAGLRVSMAVALATARVRFHVDVNIGDPVWPAPEQVEVPRLLGGAPIRLAGYPLHMVYAEKIVTAAQRGTVNTRWRDFGDVWTLSRARPVDGTNLQTAIVQVASHRGAMLSPLRDVLDGYPAMAQPKWALWRNKQRLDALPPEFAQLLEDYLAFADPAVAARIAGLSWDPSSAVWR